MKNLYISILTIFVIVNFLGCSGSEVSTKESEQKTKIISVLGINFQWQDEPVKRDYSGAVDYCNNLTLQGYNDWRLPSSEEFFALLDNNKSIDEHFSIQDKIKDFWTSTLLKVDNSKAWKVSAWSNTQSYHDKNQTFGVRCVRGDSIDDIPKVDKLWQDDIENSTNRFTWDEAKTYCQTKQMRLPTIFELQSITEVEFKNLKKDDFLSYWSITPLPTDTTSSLTVDFLTAGVSFSDKNTKNYVRCVKTINHAPIAQSSKITINEDEIANITLLASDVDGNTLSYTYTSPIHGILTSTAPNLIYEPDKNYFGSDSFTFRVSDGELESEDVTIDIIVNAVNDAPIASILASGTIIVQGESISFSAINSSDIDGDIINYKWEIGGSVVSNDINFTTNSFSIGEHVVTLSVTDNDNIVATDAILVIVESATEIFLKLPKTGQTISYANYDDGNYTAGADSNFSKNMNVVVDNSTGLMWQDDINTTTYKYNWIEANNNCNNLNLNLFDDWRLPNAHELYYLAKKGDIVLGVPFENIANGGYWSSGMFLNKAIFVNFLDATEDLVDIDIGTNYVRCVRDTSGQLVYNLTRNNQVVIDHVHKLMWEDSFRNRDKSGNWIQALNYCQNLNSKPYFGFGFGGSAQIHTVGYDDWRLPNIHELYSILEPFKSSPKFNSIFSYTQDANYWSSTTYNESYISIQKIYTIDFTSGRDEVVDFNQTHNIRCVRDIP